MRIFIAFFLVAIVHCYGNDECDQKGKSCIQSLEDTRYDTSSTRGQLCSELARTVECLTEATEICAGKPVGEHLKEALIFFNNIKKTECSVVGVHSDDTEIDNCIQGNEDYITECLQIGEKEVNEKLANPPENKDLEALRTCGLYIETVFCGVGRVDEKCGKDAVKAFVMDIGEPPEGIQNACRLIGVEIVSGLDDEDKRKK